MPQHERQHRELQQDEPRPGRRPMAGAAQVRLGPRQDERHEHDRAEEAGEPPHLLVAPVCSRIADAREARRSGERTRKEGEEQHGTEPRRRRNTLEIDAPADVAAHEECGESALAGVDEAGQHTGLRRIDLLERAIGQQLGGERGREQPRPGAPADEQQRRNFGAARRPEGRRTRALHEQCVAGQGRDEVKRQIGGRYRHGVPYQETLGLRGHLHHDAMTAPVRQPAASTWVVGR